MDSSISVKSKHVSQAHPRPICILGGLQMCAQSSGTLRKNDSLKVYEEVKKQAENENTGCCQCFPNDCSVVWHWSRRLLGPGPIHLCLGSSLSNAIWTSEVIVSLMWQPKLGCFYLSSSGVKKEEERNITNVFFQWFLHFKTGWPSRYLDAVHCFDVWHDLSPLISAGVM